MIEGNQAGHNFCLHGSLITYQCREAVVSEKGEMPNPKCGRRIFDIELVNAHGLSVSSFKL